MFKGGPSGAFSTRSKGIYHLMTLMSSGLDETVNKVSRCKIYTDLSPLSTIALDAFVKAPYMPLT